MLEFEPRATERDVAGRVELATRQREQEGARRVEARRPGHGERSAGPFAARHSELAAGRRQGSDPGSRVEPRVYEADLAAVRRIEAADLEPTVATCGVTRQRAVVSGDGRGSDLRVGAEVEVCGV